jgi:hypothetical protein
MKNIITVLIFFARLTSCVCSIACMISYRTDFIILGIVLLILANQEEGKL